jgi:hypothetical protein
MLTVTFQSLTSNRYKSMQYREFRSNCLMTCTTMPIQPDYSCVLPAHDDFYLSLRNFNFFHFHFQTDQELSTTLSTVDSASSAQLTGVTWGCSAEFDADVDTSISFVDPNAFISFPNWISRTGAMVSFKVRTKKSGLPVWNKYKFITSKPFIILCKLSQTGNPV